MNKKELRAAVQEMNTYQFGQKKELTKKLSKVTSFLVKQEVVDMVSKLDKEVKAELPVIPQFVADCLDDFKKQNLTLGDALDIHFEDDKQIHAWLYEDGEVRNDEVFARAWLDGYAVEPEKKYILKNQRGFVSSMIVQQSQAKLKSHIRINYTEDEKEAREFNKYEKDFFTEVGHLEVEEVIDK